MTSFLFTGQALTPPRSIKLKEFIFVKFSSVLQLCVDGDMKNVREQCREGIWFQIYSTLRTQLLSLEVQIFIR
jgi:hypothetical protein